jgi:nucleotide-binding universal stress UspA family protein
MEYILVPTDFSKNAYNALEYAIEVSKIFETKIIVLHTYQKPASGSSSMMKIEGKMKSLAEDDIVKLQRTLLEKGLIDDVEIEFEHSNASITSGIKNQLNSKDIGLIIMGSTGSSGLKELFLGSNTFDVIKKSTCPVLAIPSNATFKKIKNIIFATDFDMGCKNNNLPVIFKLTRKLGAKLTLVNIQTGETDFKKTRDNADRFFEECKESLKGINYEHHYILNEDISNGINSAYKNNDADLLVMVKKSHSLIEFIFKKSITKCLVSEAKLPLLTLLE